MNRVLIPLFLMSCIVVEHSCWSECAPCVWWLAGVEARRADRDTLPLIPLIAWFKWRWWWCDGVIAIDYMDGIDGVMADCGNNGDCGNNEWCGDANDGAVSADTGLAVPILWWVCVWPCIVPELCICVVVSGICTLCEVWWCETMLEELWLLWLWLLWLLLWVWLLWLWCDAACDATDATDAAATKSCKHNESANESIIITMSSMSSYVMIIYRNSIEIFNTYYYWKTFSSINNTK
jgi:hypothetical protein